ncbi:MAG: hypothetical protein M1829_006292 [Trizodia sp. TS-e1964]|nr:MAG: hypothetical protein M1829_006292 [Trizodia sp. TS-e1964]
MFENFSFEPVCRQELSLGECVSGRDASTAIVEQQKQSQWNRGSSFDTISPFSSRQSSPGPSKFTSHFFPPPPRQTPLLTHTPPLSITELSLRLSAHSLKPHPSHTLPPTPPADFDLKVPSAVTIEEGFFEMESAPTSPVLSPQQPCRRLQRQLHTVLQTDEAHLKSLASLVDSMIATGSQCRITPLPSPTFSPSPAAIAPSQLTDPPRSSTAQDMQRDFLAWRRDLDGAISRRGSAAMEMELGMATANQTPICTTARSSAEMRGWGDRPRVMKRIRTPKRLRLKLRGGVLQ